MDSSKPSSKFSFSISSKYSSKPISKHPKHFHVDSSKDAENPKQEFVTEFDASKTITEKPNFVIDPLENTWIERKRMKNIDLPFKDPNSDLQFEMETLSASEVGSDMSYGLNVRNMELIEENTVVKSGLNPTLDSDFWTKRYKEDIENIPDETDDFENMPIENFAAALLTGFGWKEGMGVGRNSKGNVKVVEYERRGAREGLGFNPESHDKKTKRDNRESSILSKKGYVEDDKKLNPTEPKRSENLSVGEVVRVIDGKYEGQKGIIMEKTGSDLDSSRVILKLLKTEEEIAVGLIQVAELGSVKEDNCLKRLQELKSSRTKTEENLDLDRGYAGRKKECDRKESKRSREEERRNYDEKKTRKELVLRKKNDHSSEKQNIRASWLTSHIRVRIISKDFKRGKLYLKKGEVMDVVGPTTCDISMDDSRELIQGVDQGILETALPKRGGLVLVLYGRYKGILGHLVEKDMEKETGVVRDADNHELLTVRLEQIAEYVGDPSYLGY